MKTYQVGGSVRDELMGLKPKDYDFLVVGATEAELLSLGFVKVGKDFPVFHHPVTKDEYALARTEKKTGSGYGGFVTETLGVTLEEDLFRRDLTINAMAKDESGVIIDPYKGQEDLKNKVLRHVSIHFGEDPLRVLRVARFAARYPQFSVHPQTMALMKELTESEIHHLAVNRFLKEFERAMQETSAYRFLEVLAQAGFFESYLPEWVFSSTMKLVDQQGSSLAKMLALVMTQPDSATAYGAAVAKLGFDFSVFKEAYKMFPSLSQCMTMEELARYTLSTQLHRKDEVRLVLEETFILLGKDTQCFRQVERIKAMLKAIDFSFLESVPVQERKTVQLKTLLERLK